MSENINTATLFPNELPVKAKMVDGKMVITNFRQIPEDNYGIELDWINEDCDRLVIKRSRNFPRGGEKLPLPVSLGADLAFTITDAIERKHSKVYGAYRDFDGKIFVLLSNSYEPEEFDEE